MTILFLISTEGYYGAENMLVTLADALRALGCDCVLGILANSLATHEALADAAHSLGICVEIIPCTGKVDWNAVVRIRQLSRHYDADVLHSQGYKSDIYALASSLFDRRPLVATSHNWPSRVPRMRAYATVDRQVLRRFDRVAVVSAQVRTRLLHAGVLPRDISTIPNGIDVRRFNNGVAVLRRERQIFGPTIGFVGRLVPQKGGVVLLHAAQQVLRSAPDTTFVFVGDGPAREEWQTLSTTLDVQKSVIFTGARSDMPNVYASLDIVVLPSLVEAMPMCLLEAMAAGRPVIASRVGSVPEMIVPGETGLLVEPNDPGEIARSILKLLRDHELANSLGTSAHHAIATRFSSEAMAKRYLDLYNAVLAARARRARAAVAQAGRS